MDVAYPGQRRGVGSQPGRQGGERVRRAGGLDHDPAVVVAHPAIQPETGREAVDERTEADSLHGPVDLEPVGHPPLDRARRRLGRSRVRYVIGSVCEVVAVVEPAHVRQSCCRASRRTRVRRPVGAAGKTCESRPSWPVRSRERIHDRVAFGPVIDQTAQIP